MKEMFFGCLVLYFLMDMIAGYRMSREDCLILSKKAFHNGYSVAFLLGAVQTGCEMKHGTDLTIEALK